MYPYYDANHDESHGRHSHSAIVQISEIVCALRNNLETEQSATSEQFAESAYHDEDDAVTESVRDAIHE